MLVAPAASLAALTPSAASVKPRTQLPAVVMSALPKRLANGLAPAPPVNWVHGTSASTTAVGQQKPALPLRSAWFSAGSRPPLATKSACFQPSQRSSPAGALGLALVAGSHAWCW